MANESALRSRIVELLRAEGFFVQAIESTTTPGIPDIYYRKSPSFCGWLELKHIKEMPKRSDTAIFKSMNHSLSNEQMNWIELELKHGGRADILVGFERRYFFVDGEHCREFNNLTHDSLIRYELSKVEITTMLLTKTA